MANDPADKKRVFRAILFAWVASAVFIGLGYWLVLRQDWLDGHHALTTLAMTLILPAFALGLGIGGAARTRHFDAHIDGSAPAAGSRLDLILRYNRNTLEQLFLFVLMAICLLAAAPDFAQNILPVLGLWFAIARLLFWIGYRRNPVDRAFGFAATFHPTLFFLAVAAIQLVRQMSSSPPVAM